MNRRLTLTAVLVVAAVPLAGVAWQRLASANDLEHHPAPGALVSIDGQANRLHLHTQGRRHRERNPKSPVVVLDAGTPGFSAQWAWAQSSIAQFATVVSYDRPGQGWSDPVDNASQSPRATTRHLHAALQKLSLPGPYLLVGHSFGALTSRLFAAEYPDDVTGLVLVDPSHPDQASRLDMGDAAGSMRFMGPLTNVGALRLGQHLGLFDKMIGDLPKRQADEAAALFLQPTVWTAVQEELASWDEIATDLRHAAPLGDLPLTVLTAGTDSPEGWEELHEELARLSSRGSHTIVPEATHLSLLTDREHARASVDAVRTLLSTSNATPTPSDTPTQPAVAHQSHDRDGSRAR